MFRQAMTMLAVLLAVGLAQAVPVGHSVMRTSGAGEAISQPSLPGVNLEQSGTRLAGTDGKGGVDAGYILQPLGVTFYGCTGFGSYSMGFRFRPILTGTITKLGRYRDMYSEASTIKVWDSLSGTAIATATVSGTYWSYVDITPIVVTAGQTYFITTYGGNYVAYGYIPTVPVNSNDITIVSGAYQTGDGIPIYDPGSMMYGMPDFYFQPVPATETWTGAVSTDWNTNGNWDGNNVPGPGINAVIPGGCPRWPTTNSAANYRCKTLDIAAGGQMSVVTGKALVVDIGITDAGTLASDADITCATLDVGASGSMTIGPGVTLNCAGNITNAGTFTNNGIINCPKDFTNTGTFGSGTYSEFHFTGSSAATATTGVNALDAGCSFFDVYVSKTPVNQKIGDGYSTIGPWWFGFTDVTIIDNAVPAVMAGDITHWECFANQACNGQLKVFRAGYGGYMFGLVASSPMKSLAYGTNVFDENISGVEPGDLIGMFNQTHTFSQVSGDYYYYFLDQNSSNDWYEWNGMGPCAFFAMQAGPAGDVTTKGDADITGSLQIDAGATLINGGEADAAGSYSVAGMWTNNGTFDAGAGTVTFDGESQIAGTAAHEFNNVAITGTLYAPAAMEVNGTWACSGTFDHSSGTVTLEGSSIASGGQPFYNLTIDNATDGDVTLLDNTTVAHNLTLNNGTFAVGTHTLTLGTTGAAGTAVVNSGTFSAVGTSTTAKSTVTAAAANRPYAFTVNTGNLAAKYANFTWMGANGIDVRANANIDPTNNLSWTSFTAGNVPGTMVKIANGQTIDDIVHADFIGTAGYNIDYAAGMGHLKISDGIGARWGEDFDNDPSNLVDWATTIRHDVGVTAILSPAGTVGEHMIVFPRVTVHNYGEVAENFDVRVVITDGNDAEVFNHVEPVTGLAIGATQNFTFTVNSWDPTPKAPFHVLAQSELAGDFDPTNDKVEQDFVVGVAFTPGWHAKSTMPGGLAKDGGAMAYNPDEGLIYEMKGNKTLEFNSYSPMDSAWTTLAPIPAGLKPVKGGASMATGAGKVFVVKGNNTLEFYRYDIATSAWLPATKTVPLGGGKKVKAGGSMAFVSKPEDAGDFVYLLKGYGTEFYRYDVTNDSFTPLASAPAGMKPKYDKGSWIAYDGERWLYVCKSKYGINGSEFYKYDVIAEAWSTAVLPAIQLVDGMGKKKKVGDGSCAAFGGDALYALKGNNNNTFWKYTAVDSGVGTWAEKETMPQVAQTGDKKKKVKAGAALVYVPDMGVFYAQKGNKVNQFWQYGPSSVVMANERPTRDGVAAGSVTKVALSMSVSPSPLVTGYATLRYSLPKSGVAMMNVYDVTGRSVMTRTLNTGRTGSTALDLRNLSAGVYLVKLSSDSFSTSQKLVVER